MDLIKQLSDAPFVGFETTQVASACGVSRQAIEQLEGSLGIVPGRTAAGMRIYSGRDLAIFRAHYEGKRRRGELA